MVTKKSHWEDVETFGELKPGTIVRSIKNPDRFFVVTFNYANRVTAVTSVDITNPKEWEILIDN